MAYDAPTTTELKTRYPEFTSIDDARVTLFIEDANRSVDDSWVEGDYKIAIMCLAAHMMAIEGLLNPAGSTAAGATSGPITSEKLGDASVSYGERSGGRFGITGADAVLAATSYGQRFISLRNANHAGPQIIP
jgi:hypothetical protein